MPEIVGTVTIDVTTEATAKRSSLINRKHLIVEALRGNTGKIFIGISYQYTGAGLIDTKYEPIKVGEPRFYGAPMNKEINYIWYYAENAGDGFKFVGSDGALARPNFRGDIRLGKFVRETVDVTLTNDAWAEERRTVPAGKRWFIYGGQVHNPDDVARDVYVALQNSIFDDIGFFKPDDGLDAGNKQRFPIGGEIDPCAFAPESYPVIAEAGESVLFYWTAGGVSTGGDGFCFLEYIEVDLS